MATDRIASAIGKSFIGEGYPGVDIFNAHGKRNKEEVLFGRLIQRIHNTSRHRGTEAIIISDEGKNYDYLLRRMRRISFVPSAYGGWQDTGSYTKNIPVNRVLEDIVYRDSRRSYFVQAADFCVFSLLQFENPSSKSIQNGVHRSFMLLKPALFPSAFAADPKKLNIIRA